MCLCNIFLGFWLYHWGLANKMVNLLVSLHFLYTVFRICPIWYCQDILGIGFQQDLSRIIDSRMMHDPNVYLSSDWIFEKLCIFWNPPTIDLFDFHTLLVCSYSGKSADISLSNCYVAPPPQPHHKSHLNMNLYALHWTWEVDQPHPFYYVGGKRWPDKNMKNV